MKDNEKCYTHCGRLPGQTWLFFFERSQTVVSDLHFSNSLFELNMCYVSGVLKLGTAL